MQIQTQASSVLKTFSIIFLFFWISFFAPLVQIFWNFLFLGISGVLLLAILYLDRGALKAVFNKNELPLLLFVLAFALGIAPAQDKTLAMWHLYRFIIPIPIAYFILKLSFQEKRCIIVIRFICAMASLVAFYGAIEFFTRYNFIYEKVMYNMYYIPFIGRRMISTQGHPAALSTYLVSILPLTLILITKEQKFFLKILSWLYAAIIFLGIMLCFSRGGLIGLFLSFAVIIFFTFRQKRLFLIFCLSGGVLFLILISTILYLKGYHMFYRYNFSELLGCSYFKKFHIFLSIGKILSDHPFLGLGLGHFRIFFDRYVPILAGNVAFDSKVADCMYLTLLAETGLVGFFAFIAFIGCLFKRIKNSLTQSFVNPERRMLIVCFLAGLIGNLGSFLTYDMLYWAVPACLFWFYSGILSSLSENV